MLTQSYSHPKSRPGFGGWIANALALKKTSLEYICISIGFFSNYRGMPHINSNLKPFNWFLDMEKGIAVVPGTGDEKFTVTYSEDLARVIVRLHDTDNKWPERGPLSGSDISLNELIASAERIRGIYLHFSCPGGLGVCPHITTQAPRSMSSMILWRSWTREMPPFCGTQKMSLRKNLNPYSRVCVK